MKRLWSLIMHLQPEIILFRINITMGNIIIIISSTGNVVIPAIRPGKCTSLYLQAIIFSSYLSVSSMMGIVVFILTLGICCAAAVGQGDDYLWTLPLTIKANPPCGEEGFCERGTAETGHRLYTALTEDIVDVERCYSFCFSNVSNLLTNILLLSIAPLSGPSLSAFLVRLCS